MSAHYDVDSQLQPRMRGVIHAYAVGVFLAAGIVLVALAGSTRARVAMAVYSAGLVGCLTTSAVYHRGRWTPGVKRWLGRFDHAAIFILIASTYTPVCVLVLSGTLSLVMLAVVWTGAAVGIAMSLLWRRPPAIAEVAPYVILGWVGLLAIPQLLSVAGGGALAMLLVGGGLYTVGAIIYALHWPNPFPRTFGYHEIFHTFVVAAATVHMVLVFVWVMPRGWI